MRNKEERRDKPRRYEEDRVKMTGEEERQMNGETKGHRRDRWSGVLTSRAEGKRKKG